jgi:hypothetical protein
MPALPNPKHETFAQELAKGSTLEAAYLTAGFKAHRGNSFRLSENEHVKGRVNELKTEANGASTLSKQEAIEWLCKAITTPVGKIDENSPLAQEVIYKPGEKRVKSVSKMDALKTLGSWCGWEKGTEAENKLADTLGASIRAHARRR